jgi:hypothetical protein
VRSDSNAGSTTVTFYLSQSVASTSDMTGVHLLAHLADDQGLSPASFSAAFSALGSDVTSSGVDVPSGGREVPVVMTLSNLPAAGRLTGDIVAEYAGQTRRVSLTVERFPQPALVLAGAGPSGALELTEPSSQFRHQFLIESTNLAPVTDLAVYAAPLQGPDGTVAPLEVVVSATDAITNPHIVPGLGTTFVQVTATLPLTGTYTGAIALVYGGQRQTTTLTILRERRAPAVAILGAAAAISDPWWLPCWSQRPSCAFRRDVSLRLSLEDQGSEPVTLTVPTFTALALNSANQVASQAQIQGLDVSDANTQVPLPPTSTITLQPGETRSLNLVVRGLPSAGQYTGNLRLSAADAEPLDQSVTLVVKEPGWLAMFFITFGVTISFFMRRFTQRRPRLVQAGRIALLLRDIEQLPQSLADLKPQEQSVLNTWRDRLNTLADRLALGTAANADDALTELDGKLPLFPAWISLRRRVDALTPETLQPPFRAVLDEVRDFFVRAGDKPADIDQEQKKLGSQDAQIDEAVKAALQTALEAFKADLSPQLKDLGPLDNADLRNKLQVEVEARLDEAKQLLDQDRVPAALAAFDQARFNYARLMAARLEAILADPGLALNPAPDEWGRRKQQITQLLGVASAPQATPEAAVQSYKEAYSDYLAALTDSLRNAVTRRENFLPQESGLPLDKQKGYLDRLTAIKGQLEKVAQLLKAGSQTEAAKTYTAAQKEYERVAADLKDELAKKGFRPAAFEAPAPEVGGPVPGAIGETATDRAAAGQPHAGLTLRTIQEQINLGDRLVLVVAIVAAVLIGLQFLWAGNPTWGGSNDYTTAILWGLGLHQVSGAAFDGVLNLADRLSNGAKA